MELLESIHESLIEQNRKHGRNLYPSTDKHYINYALNWDYTKEEFLFWHILNTSYKSYDTYDYNTIIKLHNLYSDEVFKLIIEINHEYYDDYYDSEKNTLTSEGFEYLCKQIERYGIVSMHS